MSARQNFDLLSFFYGIGTFYKFLEADRAVIKKMLLFNIFIIYFAGLCFSFFDGMPSDSIKILFLDDINLTTISSSSVIPL